MKTILVDDELWMMELFEEECSSIPEIQLCGKFDCAEDALRYAEDNRVDLAFLDIEMPGMNGLELSQKLRELYPDIIIIFVSAYDQYMKEAFSERDADYFVSKPYEKKQVTAAIERAKLLAARQKKQVVIRTFGNFEVYVNGEALKFTSMRAREILALLVDCNGDSLSSESMYYEIWPGQEYSHTEAGKFRHALQRLQKTLVDAGIENILCYSPHARAIKTDMVECDYFDFLREDEAAIKKYQGTYMFQFTWGEERAVMLSKIKNRYLYGK